MKYVMFSNDKLLLRLPVIFPDMLVHSSVCAGKDWKPTSAGFFDPHTGKVFGESDSLKLKSSPFDEELVLLVHADVGAIQFLLASNSYAAFHANMA